MPTLSVEVARASYTTEREWLVALLVLVPIAFALVVIIARLRDRAGCPRILSEPPEDIHPVDLALLWSAYHHHLSPRTAYRAEIIHLARIGAIDLEPVGRMSDPDDFLVHFRHMPETEMDRDFVRFMFPEAGTSDVAPLRLRSLRRTGRRSRLGSWWEDAFERVASGVQRIWLDTRPEFYIAALVGIVGTPLAIVKLAPHFERLGDLALFVFLAGAAGWLISAWALPPRLHSEMRLHLQMWLAFRRYLKRFRSLRDAPAEAVVIWERYLEDAAALGVAGRVDREIRAINAVSSLPSPWSGAPDGLIGASWIRHLWRHGPSSPPPGLS